MLDKSQIWFIRSVQQAITDYNPTKVDNSQKIVLKVDLALVRSNTKYSFVVMSISFEAILKLLKLYLAS